MAAGGGRSYATIASLSTRYHAGEFVRVWGDLIALGAAVRSPRYREDAYAVALETMRRVRHNVEILHRRLLHLGYRFRYPQETIAPPAADAAAVLADIEGMIGDLPLSLRAFYEVVGAVDFTQSSDQLVQ